MSRGAAEDNPITSPLLRPTTSACDDYIIMFVAPTLSLTIHVCSHLLVRKSHLDPETGDSYNPWILYANMSIFRGVSCRFEKNVGR
jgi:hypothetical protein